MHQPGKVTKRTVLNVFGPMGQGGRYILDSLKTGAVHADYYHDTDLVVGGVVNVWGRKFLICGCDEFTQEYYKSKYGHGNQNISYLHFCKGNLILLNLRFSKYLL